MILGMGIDIVQISRMENVLAKWRDRFTSRVFTRQEIDFCMSKRLPGQHFATRFAAKEAFLKAIGMGMGAGIPWKEIEVIKNSIGKPQVALHCKAKEISHKNNVKNVFLSLSHDGEYGVAQVILEG